jgi:translation initiation factor 3 subunit F
MASTSPSLLFSKSSSSAQVEAVVLFNICDSYVRRPDQAERVIGTLLGSVLPDGTVHVRNCYVVPHSESAEQVFFSSAHRVVLQSRFLISSSCCNE